MSNDIAPRGGSLLERFDPNVMSSAPMTGGVGLQITNMGQAMELSKLMALSGPAVPKAFRNEPALCFSVVNLAVKWGMDPYAVIKKAYVVNDVVAFEAQLVHALVLVKAPIVGRVRNEFTGEGPSRRCRVWATLSPHVANPDGADPEYESPLFGVIKPKNSPLWINDPDQQLFYFSVRAFARRHFPEILLGVYSEDEIDRGRPPADAIRAMPNLDQFSAPRADGAKGPLMVAGGGGAGYSDAGVFDGAKVELQPEAAKPEPEPEHRNPTQEPPATKTATRRVVADDDKVVSDADDHAGPVMPTEILAGFEAAKSKWIPAWNWLRSQLNAQADDGVQWQLAQRYKAVLQRVSREDPAKVAGVLTAIGVNPKWLET